MLFQMLNDRAQINDYNDTYNSYSAKKRTPVLLWNLRLQLYAVSVVFFYDLFGFNVSFLCSLISIFADKSFENLKTQLNVRKIQ